MSEIANPRFAFGKNWSRYAQAVEEAHLDAATHSLQQMLESENLQGQSFLDIGCGSGLFSVVAARLGAQVRAFDYDTDSVETTRALWNRFGPSKAPLHLEQGDVLDAAYMERLGTHDIVYSWGVLHHTGAMWDAMNHAAARVRPGGTLFIALYNHQPFWSSFWKVTKRTYCRAPRPVQAAMYGTYTIQQTVRGFLVDVLRGRNPRTRYKVGMRGITIHRDRLDWLGGYPFEVATPGQVLQWADEHGFDLVRSELVGRRLGCNQYVFRNRANEA